MSLLACPNEILEEIFSYLRDDYEDIYTWDTLIQSDPSNPFESANKVAKSPEPNEPRIGFKYIATTKYGARASLYDLRSLCRRFEAIVASFAFSTVYICDSLEHTQLITRKFVGHEPDPFARYIKHIVISPMSLLPKDCLFPKDRARIFGEAEAEESEKQRLFNDENESRWALIFIDAITSLFSDLPDSVTELTIRTLEPLSETEDIVGQVNELFLKVFSLATRAFLTTKLRTLHIYAQSADSISYLWRGFEIIEDVTFYARPCTYTYSQRPYLENLRELNIRSKSACCRDMGAITEWLPKTMEHISIKSPYIYGSAYPPGFKLANARNLKSIVLEGIDKFDESVVLFLLNLENCSKLHIYGSDITNAHSWAGDIAAIDLRWGHVFKALTELPRLVDFQAGNLSYTTIRQTYKYLDLEKIWLFTDYLSDFDAFSAFRTTLIERRKRLGLPQHTWLSKTSVYDGGSQSLKAYGLIVATIADVLRHRRLAIRAKSKRMCNGMFSGNQDNIVGKVERKDNKLVYLMSGSWATERDRNGDSDLWSSGSVGTYGGYGWEDL
ncbi:hypothetical protein TWF506_005461 [Arthrobotrys conoides]|uniref:Uncharacterized protein n=1 Tax=Arthrobotrys conoides TaxID=74498 RepID=A0AAN8NJN9_9PEZI